jgi:oxygen-independent coproporphyrinogen-3 oxidase
MSVDTSMKRSFFADMNDLKKYFKPVPRYTSYPTVPFWDQNTFNLKGFEQSIKTTYWESAKEVSIYIHLPFCERLCTYCACNTRITKNHQVEGPYIDRVLKEWQMYLAIFPDKPIIREIHLGGGTPTFFSPENLDRLISGLKKGSVVNQRTQMSFEGHPGNTTPTHLQTLFDAGFDRVSFGIQDFDPKVQELIHRMQSFEQVQFITQKAREIGYTSVNYDIVYGLPGQNIISLNATLDKVAELSPDRIAFYSYAHVPTIRPAQRAYEAYLPTDDERYLFMNTGKKRLLEMGYQEVGMDHYVKADDELVKAIGTGRLHRNFMGYTVFTSRLLVGLGASSIGDAWTGFAQNEKHVESYYQRIDAGELPIVRGHLLSAEDVFIRKHILRLMCRFETSWTEEDFLTFGSGFNFELLTQLQSEGFIQFSGQGITVLPQGQQLIRVICSALDARMNSRTSRTQFSKSI